MEINSSSVPITALHAYRLNERVLLLSGQGSTLVAHDCEDRGLLFQKRVFGSEVIHGISTETVPAIKPGETGVRVLLWAGSAAAFLRFSLLEESTRDMILRLTELCVIDLCDWALFGNFLEFDSRGMERAYIVTAHNEVYKIALHQHPVTKSSTKSCERLVSGPRSVLYSAYACSTSTGLLIAAGTVFGEIVVWSANKNETSDAWSPKILNVLLGHKGSIFGVCISEDLFFAGEYRRLLATCSDDRSIRLWNVNNEAQSTRIDEDGFQSIQLSDVTGFGDLESNSKSLLAMAWGHSSRIWTIRFLPTDSLGETKKFNLVSTGEDASLRLWQGTINSTIDDNKSKSIQLREFGSHINHSGKNIWSSDYHLIGGKYAHYTGGADGLIVATTLSKTADTKADSRNFRTQMSFDDVFHQSEVNDRIHSSDSNLKTMTLKHYAIADDGSIFATTAIGDLVHGSLKMENETISWQKIHATQSESSLLLCSDRASGSVFFANAGGNLFAIEEGSGKIISSSITIAPHATLMCIAPTEDHDLSRKRQSSIFIPLPKECSVTLIGVIVAGSIRLESSVRLVSPPNFVPTSGCHHVQQGLLVLGSRSGSIAIYDRLIDSESTVAVFLNLHNTDTITSIMFLDDGKFSEQIAARDLFIVTTGRDGIYAVHTISRTSASDRAWTLQTIHRSSPPIGPNIEGAYLFRNAASQMQELVLYGFRSKDFVVWNETEQTEVLAVDCGGAHRSWAYSPLKHDGSGEALYGGIFIWTKAGACHVYRKSDEDHHRIQHGGHGREIKALAVLPLRLGSNGVGLGNAGLVATGAEDTTIRLFAVKASDSSVAQQAENKKLTCIHILNKHTTGIHHLEFSPSGNYLISSGGCEELFVWRLRTNVPIVGLGLVLECMLPKTEVDADARITSFRVGKQNEPTFGSVDGTGVNFEIVATYSNGKVKIWIYLCEQGNRRGHFELLEEIVLGSFCLTQLHYDAKDEIMLTAGTNGVINVHFPRQWNLLWKQKVHQNNIQASVLVKIPAFSLTWLVVTGGDDNALGLTIFCPDSASSSRSISAFRTLLIPNAHAAAVTGLALISQPRTIEGSIILTFASVSNDQRVKIWCVNFQTKNTLKEGFEMQDVQIERVAECWTSIADAASIEVLPSIVPHDIRGSQVSGTAGESNHELLIVGVGMEVLRTSAD